MSKAKRSLLVVALAIIIGGIYSPFLATLWWHVSNGNMVQYGTKRISVPLRWMPMDSSLPSTSNFNLVKLPLTVLLENEPHAYVNTYQFIGRKTDGQSNLAAWELAFRIANENTGNVTGPQKPEGLPPDIYCMKMSPRAHPQKLVISCLLPGGMQAADFMGDSRDLNIFFNIIRQLL
jgi:hypothetical protein